MPLIIEDGTGVVDADSYIDATDAAARGVVLGLTLPTDVVELEAMLIQGAVFMNALCFIGEKTYPISINMLTWPRTGIDDIAADVVPSNVVDAQLVYAAAIYAGLNIWGTPGRSRRIKTKKVGDTSWTYADDGKLSDAVGVPYADALLGLWLCTDNNFSSNGLSFNVKRG